MPRKLDNLPPLQTGEIKYKRLSRGNYSVLRDRVPIALIENKTHDHDYVAPWTWTWLDGSPDNLTAPSLKQLQALGKTEAARRYPEPVPNTHTIQHG